MAVTLVWTLITFDLDNRNDLWTLSLLIYMHILSGLFTLNHNSEPGLLLLKICHWLSQKLFKLSISLLALVSSSFLILFPTTLILKSYAPINLNYSFFLVHGEYFNTATQFLMLSPLPSSPSLQFLHT